MDKNKDNTFDVPAAEIQDKITLLMGLPPEEATARLDKNSALAEYLHVVIKALMTHLKAQRK
ncbi:MAG: hypothetical protein R3B12_05235 [Candidatus Saccharimonadales bacterium]